MFVGIDSCLPKREKVSLTGEPRNPFKALLGALVSSEDEDQFRDEYDKIVGQTLDKLGVEQLKLVAIKAKKILAKLTFFIDLKGLA